MTSHDDIQDLTITPKHNPKFRFSILIPSWNNLDYLKLCINSIRKNSTFTHEILVHLNEATDGSLEWIKSQPDLFCSYSRNNLGVCYPLNHLASRASTNYIVYMNDDMYACPEWDSVLAEEIDKIGHKYFFLSSTAIEAAAHKSCSVQKNFGRNIEEFNETSLLKTYRALNIPDWQGATWPPNIVHRDIWAQVGGYSIEFSPGMYSDPDFSMKLWHAGIRIFKGVNASKVYHFGSLSVKRVKKNRGYFQFISKWGVTSGTVTNHYLHRGLDFSGPLQAPRIPALTKLKNFFRRVQSAYLHS
ncbi:hypothetical protein GCM10023091_23140 [Ravibacter arvi]|uniref:Glycosyltransferase 2-like domain-containing protein n=1 Tax=Ravibacter arvi TaxID=2051041 RepID=A0ABP8LZT6_9BACT